jgi:DNA processing protein
LIKKSTSPEELLGRPLNEIEQKFAPTKLFLTIGNGIPLPGPRVAIVGSRKASSQGIRLTQEIASFLAGRKVIIVSGLAEGIDTAAHEEAIRQGGLTVAVLGTPLDRIYPAKNGGLQKTIMRGHWAISQFPVGYPTEPKNFVIRNRTMALISDASIIVEAGETSGSLLQGWEALRLGRPLFISKLITGNASLRWPKKMMDYGANELTEFENVIDILPSSERILQIAC